MPSPGKHPCYQKGKGKKFPHFWRSQIHVKKTKQGLRSWGTFHPLSGLSDCELYTVDIFFCCIFFCSAMTAGSYKMTQGFAGGDRDGWWSFSKNQKTTPQRFWFPLTPPQHLWFYNGQIGFMMVQYIYIYIHIIVTINDYEGTSSTQLSWDTQSQVVRMEHQVNFLGFPNLHPKLVGGKAISRGGLNLRFVPFLMFETTSNLKQSFWTLKLPTIILEYM